MNKIQSDFNNNNKDSLYKTRRFKCVFLANLPINTQTCNLQLNRKVCEYGFRPGSVIEITLSTSTTQSLNVQSPSTSVLNSSFNSSFCKNDSLLNSDDHTSPLLLQITEESLRDDISVDTIRIDPAACMEPFNLCNYSYVNVKLVPLENIKLDLVEVIFKEQYFNGSDMWRIKKHLQDTCVYIKKNIEYCGMRFTVREMWMNGEIVTCGYINEETRLVFRSQSAMCTIYVQMSSEMWEFDVNGEMYHEKAINFFAELFTNWKNQTCTHDVTIALFSRVFYEANSINEFPSELIANIRQDHKNRYFEDFYRIIYQNERYEDWTFVLVKLKHLIKEYRDYILRYHQRLCSEPVPKCYLSNAAEGNFLETLNLSSSVFERSFIDRPFDRTGMMSLIVTGGCGVFEVSKNLLKITKGRVIDNGIGCDLICLGEQPLHQVPLFKFADSDTYSVPYWINLSFYKSSETIRYCNSKFTPRIKIKFKPDCDTRLDPKSILPGYEPLKHDEKLEDSDDYVEIPKDLNTETHEFTKSINSITKQQSLISKSVYTDNEDILIECDSEPESAPTNHSALFHKHMNRKKVNPFSPSTINQRSSFDRRRWAHLFPMRPDGTPIFHHWKRVKSTDTVFSDAMNSDHSSTLNQSSDTSLYEQKSFIDDLSISYGMSQLKIKEINENSSLQNPTNKAVNNLLNRGNDADNEECIATMIAGVAWKSLTIPACLPLTTDYLPNEDKGQDSLEPIKEYTLVLDKIREENNFIGAKTRAIKIINILPELVGNRLALGFQLVQFKNDQKTVKNSSNSHSYKVCSSYMYHELSYGINEETNEEYVQVKIWIPKKKINRLTEEYNYVYRFQVPDSKFYHVSYCEFLRKNPKKIEWDIIDRYVCIQGNGSISPLELQNCWRQRLYVLPLMYIQANNQQNLATLMLTQAATGLNNSQIVCGTNRSTLVESSIRFDVYHRKSIEELKLYRENYFIRFMEFLNKVTRADDRRITYNSSAKRLQNLLPSPKDHLEKLLQKYNEAKKSQDDSVKAHKEEITSYLEKTYQKAMLTDIPVLSSKEDIPPNCFISAEATWWCIQNIQDINTEAQAINLLQTMLDFDIIMHISKYEKTYIHGFYLYYILTNENRRLNFQYTKDYCEVGLCEFERGLQLDEKTLFTKKLPRKQELLPVSGTEYSYSQYGLNSTLESPIVKIVNVDVDPQHKSTRIEWASALYRSYHHPLCAFELEIYWKMATGQLLYELINNWAKKSSKFNFHIIPGLIDPFTTPFESSADPLRGYIYIPLSTKTLIQDEKILFEKWIENEYFECDEQNCHFLKLKSADAIFTDDEFKDFLCLKYKTDASNLKMDNKQQLIEIDFQEFIEYKRMLYLQYFQEAILEKFGFIRNAAITKKTNSDDDNTFFIHSSGGMFAMIPNYYVNSKGRSRYPSSANQKVMPTSKTDNQNSFSNLNSFNKRIIEDTREERILKQSISTIDGASSNFIQIPRTLKRANSTSRLHLRFYELNKTNIINKRVRDKIRSQSPSLTHNQTDLATKSATDINNNSECNSRRNSIDIKNDFKKNRKFTNRDMKIIINDTTIEKTQPFFTNKNLFIGFLWSWNVMLGKRWRSQYTGDETFQDNALADFRAFCSNKDNRLLNFYNDIKPKCF